ncbi:uncharacterized protein LOC142349708 [Convolutriloba macropyga]|uniref:uncharacterized protein LOC142349708 n=1 Tax=Convolutriloba macropyga TaxID=536237 RepID=UPI003F520D10
MPDNVTRVEIHDNNQSFGASPSESLEDMSSASRISFSADAGSEISQDQEMPPLESNDGSARDDQLAIRDLSPEPGPLRRPVIPLDSPQGARPQAPSASSSSTRSNATANVNSSNNNISTTSNLNTAAGNASPGVAPPGTRPNNQANNNVLDLSVEVLLNLTTCGICLEIFRDPKSLPCLHSFCKRCLMTLTQNDNTLPFPCPTCRRLCGSTVSTLPDDFKSKLLVDTMRQRDLERQRSGRRSLIDAANGGHQLKPSQPVLCQNHGNRRCEFFCETCNIPVCVKCVASEHTDHRYIDVFEDTQVLIDDMEEIIESVKRDVQRLEENNTDIEIMMCEFSYLLDERVKKLKKLVDETANQVKGRYSHELMNAQGEVRRYILMHLNFIQKTTEHLSSLKDSMRDGAMFDVYADAKIHMNSSNTDTPSFLFQRPAKFEFAPCVEFQITNTFNQFFGQPGPLPEHQAIPVFRQLQLGLQSAAAGGAASSCPPPPGLSPPIVGARGNMGDSVPVSGGPAANGAIGGARRKRPNNIPSSSRRASPAVEALFSSAANASSSSSPLHFVEPTIATSQGAQAAGNFAPDRNPESSSGGISILRSILPQTAITVNHSDGTRGATVSHPLTPFFLSSVRVPGFEATPAIALTSSSRRSSSGMAPFRPEATGRTNEVQVPLIDIVSNNRTQGSQQQNVMEPQEVQQFFQSILGSDSRQTSQESVNLVPTQEGHMQNAGVQHLNRGSTAEVVSRFPDMNISADEQNAIYDQTSDDEAGQDGPGSSVNIAEETL